MAEADNSQEAVPEVKAGKVAVPWIPLVMVLLFIPIITLALVEFVVVPKLRNTLGGDADSAAAADPGRVEADTGREGGHDAKETAGGASGTSVTFENVMSNVAGTMGTRFLKVSFQVKSEDPQLAGIIRMREAQVKDAIISTLSSRTIQEIEIAGGRNALRVAMISAINGAIGLNLVQELYFLDFIIQ